jgi:hypothetical protein
MLLTNRLTKLLAGGVMATSMWATVTLAAEAQTGPGDITTPTTEPPCFVDCGEPPDDDDECPPFVATCDELGIPEPCDPETEDCEPPGGCDDTDDCPGGGPGTGTGPEPGVVDPPIVAQPTFTG